MTTPHTGSTRRCSIGSSPTGVTYLMNGTTMTNGKFVANYRVSTERQGRSGLGLDARREAVMRHLSAGGWPAWPSSPRSRRRVVLSGTSQAYTGP